VDGEKYVPGLSRIAKAVHRYGSLVYGQIIYTGPVDFENLPEAKIIKERVGLPVILVGGMNSTETLQKALDEGVDLVSMCRAFIREPDFVLKLKAGNAVSKCVRCNQCLSIGKTKYKRCVFGSEIEFLKKRLSR
jgi:2,4-dienoyl-CoA reductase-like NADH-dependent reductase (Old Yellow Enzyme family)